MAKKYDLIEIHTDGGARGNPGPAAIGAVAESDGRVLFSISKTIGNTTNNVAEYTAVISVLEKLDQDKISSEKLSFVLDSELIVRQIVGQYKVKQPHLKDLHQQIVTLVKKLRQDGIIDRLTFRHVLRSKNKQADSLVNQALDAKD